VELLSGMRRVLFSVIHNGFILNFAFLSEYHNLEIPYPPRAYIKYIDSMMDGFKKKVSSKHSIVFQNYYKKCTFLQMK